MRPMRPLPRATVPVACAAVLIMALVVNLGTVIHVLEADRVGRSGYLPDDTFYYLTLARAFDTSGSWTFDGGVSQTSGFHLLHAYALVGVHRLLSPGPEAYVKAAILFCFLLFLGGALIGAVLAVRSRRLFPSLLMCLFLLSWNVQLNAIAAMEWAWVVLLSGAYCGAFSRVKFRWAPLLLAGIGLAGALARSDFGVLPAALAGASLLGRRLGWSGGRLGRAMAGLGGAVVGTLVVLAHGHLTSGSALQSSVRMKLLWSTDLGDSAQRLAYNLLSLFGPTSTLTMVLASGLLMTALVMVVMWLRGGATHAAGEGGATGRTLWLGCAVTVAGYFLLYVHNADLQPWYTANFIIPLALILVLPFLWPGAPRRLHAVGIVLLLGPLMDQARLTRGYLEQPTWPHSAGTYRAGNFLRQASLPGRVGAWNAGVLGYYQGGEVVNLDGLVNNDIYPYARDNRLPEYIQAKGIRYLVDYINAFAPDKRRRGGFQRPDFLRRLKRLQVFDRRKSGWGGVSLYEIMPARALPVR